MKLEIEKKVTGNRWTTGNGGRLVALVANGEQQSVARCCAAQRQYLYRIRVFVYSGSPCCASHRIDL